MTGGLLALNFFSPAFVDQLKRGRKTATIRLGDKSRKYQRGQVVWITVGYQHSPREKIFAAVIDDVEVKRVATLSPARHRARQPRVPAARGDARLPAPDLRPRDRSRGHGHGRSASRRSSSRSVRSSATARRPHRTRILAACPTTSSSRPGACEAPREPVWDAIWDSERWPEWWRGVVGARTCLPRATSAGVGQVGRYTWRSKLPYDLEFEMTTTKVDKPHLLEGARQRGAGRHRALAAVRAGRRGAGHRGRLRVERAHHEALDEPVRADRAPAVRVEPRLGDAKRRRGPREASRLPSAGDRLSRSAEPVSESESF